MDDIPEDPLMAILKPQRLTAVVDIGANPIDGTPPYKRMLERGLCTVIGCEPSREAIERLDRHKSPMETYLPYVVSDGQDRTLFICDAPGMTSLLEPNPDRLRLFHGFRDFGRVNRRISVRTQKLDEIAEIKNIDFLKVDIQGSELDVFRSGKTKLQGAVAIQTEISFIPLYQQQIPLGVIDTELRGMGFIPYSFAEVKPWPLTPVVPGSYPLKGHWQPILEADLIYMRDFTLAENLTGEQWKHLALIAHHCYGAADLVMHALDMAAKLGVVATDSAMNYAKSLQSYQSH
jgi:FkbM family methyltransferase